MNNIWRITFCVICFFLAYFDKGVQFSERVFISSILIQFYSIYFIFSKEKYPFSLNKMFYLFSLIFFGFSPLMQYNHNVSFWNWDVLPESAYFAMNLLILFILILYQLIYTLFFARYSYSRKLAVHSSKNTTSYCFTRKQLFFLTIVSIISFLITFYVRDFSFLALIFRGGEYDSYILENQSQMLVVENYIRPLSMFCLLFYLNASGPKNFLIAMLLFFSAILTCFPLGMPRFAAASFYIPLSMLTFRFLRSRNVFSIVFLFGFFVGFPFLDLFRYVTEDTNLSSFAIDNEMFLLGDFDSYYNFAVIVSENIITYGRQLTGVFLFWMPRVFWPEKPIGSGAFIADKLGLSFPNISANFFAEGYINFGLFGIFLFVFVIAVITAKFDIMYYFNKRVNPFFRVFYLVLLGLLFFILRGDLLSSFAYTMGYMAAAFTVFMIVKPKYDGKV
ncbi:MAG: O-antigen polymerase [Niabella sp.]